MDWNAREKTPRTSADQQTSAERGGEQTGGGDQALGASLFVDLQAPSEQLEDEWAPQLAASAAPPFSAPNLQAKYCTQQVSALQSSELSSSSSSSLSQLSAHSAPQLGAESSTAEPGSSCANAFAQQQQKQTQFDQFPKQRRLQHANRLRPMQTSRRSSALSVRPFDLAASSMQLGKQRAGRRHKIGCFELSEQLLVEIKLYRRSLVLLALALAYTLFMLLSLLVSQQTRPENSWERELELEHDLRPPGRAAAANQAWTQEQIAGWHRERPLELADELGRPSRALHWVRSCRPLEPPGLVAAALDGAPGGASNHSHSLAAGPNGELSNATTTTTTTSGAQNSSSTTTSRPKILFHALNGCMFRRGSNSDSLGDLCCCAGKPRRIGPEQRQQQRELPALIGDKLSVNGTNGEPQKKRPKNAYLRPQIICFVSSAGGLFNGQRLVAPVANETNLRNTFGPAGRSKCIVCSCCHEHEPEQVNKMLANVAPAAEQQQQVAAAAAAAPSAKQTGGVWVSARERLLNSMRSLDELAFWLYDLLAVGLFALRHGQFPARPKPSAALEPGHWLELHAAALLDSDQAAPRKPMIGVSENQLAHSSGQLVPQLVAKLASLSMEADAYDDFRSSTTSTTSTTTSTTTSSTTTTTTSTTSTGRPSRGRKLNKFKRRRRRTTTSTTSTTTTTMAPSPISGATNSSSVRPATGANSSSTTSKAPTVIINVYAAPNSAGASSTSSTTTSTTTTTATTSTTRAPPSGLASSRRTSSGGEQANITLRIELDNGQVQAAGPEVARAQNKAAPVGAGETRAQEAQAKGATVASNAQLGQLLAASSGPKIILLQEKNSASQAQVPAAPPVEPAPSELAKSIVIALDPPLLPAGHSAASGGGGGGLQADGPPASSLRVLESAAAGSGPRIAAAAASHLAGRPLTGQAESGAGQVAATIAQSPSRSVEAAPIRI